jgi:hypothetical protein
MWGGYAGQGIAEDNAWNELKNRAAAMGADTVLLVTASTGFSGARAIGEGYHCGSVDPTKQVTLSRIAISNFVRRVTSDAQLVGSFELFNDNDFAVMSVVIECSLAGVTVRNATPLPALGPHQRNTTAAVTFGAIPFPEAYRFVEP